MEVRRPLEEWHFKQMDHAVGLSFIFNFNFALVGHLLKGKNTGQIANCTIKHVHKFTAESFSHLFNVNFVLSRLNFF